MAWVRWSWMLVACPRNARAAPNASGCMTRSRHAAERAMSDPVRRVSWPLKSSGPVGVASRKGRSSASIAVQQHRVGDALDDDGAVAADGGRHFVGAGVGAQAGDGHAPSWTTAAGTGNSCRRSRQGRLEARGGLGRLGPLITRPSSASLRSVSRTSSPMTDAWSGYVSPSASTICVDRGRSVAQLPHRPCAGVEEDQQLADVVVDRRVLVQLDRGGALPAHRHRPRFRPLSLHVRSSPTTPDAHRSPDAPALYPGATSPSTSRTPRRGRTTSRV